MLFVLKRKKVKRKSMRKCDFNAVLAEEMIALSEGSVEIAFSEEIILGVTSEVLTEVLMKICELNQVRTSTC